jgi:methionyl-tRNA formyltransferase
MAASWPRPGPRSARRRPPPTFGLGRDLLLRTLDDLEAGRARPAEQDHGASTPAPKLRKEDGRIDWRLPAAALHARIRGFNPYPVCYTLQAGRDGDRGAGRVLRIHSARVAAPGPGGPDGAAAGAASPAFAAGEGGPPPAPGSLIIGADRHPYVKAGDGYLRLVEVQWEGKPRLSGPDFVNGLQPAERDGMRFG